MIEIKTEIEIDATAERVWSILLNFPTYQTWNPFVRSIQGDLHPGQKLTVTIQPPSGKEMTFRPRVLVVTPNRELRWLGRLLVPGFFDGEHYFQIVELSANRVKFVQGEKFSGVLVAVAKGSLEGGTKSGFEGFNKAIKARAERNEP